jgi:hypothetical protein
MGKNKKQAGKKVDTNDLTDPEALKVIYFY